VITADRPGQGICSPDLAGQLSTSYCYVPDVAQRTCRLIKGANASASCAAFGLALAFSDTTLCCNKLVELSGTREELGGACRCGAGYWSRAAGLLAAQLAAFLEAAMTPVQQPSSPAAQQPSSPAAQQPSSPAAQQPSSLRT
jgi:hypothetical protein